MKKRTPEHLPASVPERKRETATIAVSLPSGPPSSPSGLPFDVRQPQLARGTPTQPGSRELIVPSPTTAESILAELRRSPAERLEVEARIAAGGMGGIEVAVDRALDRRLALKVLHPHLRSSSSAVRMFLREARLTGLLDHPHIVPIYDVGERKDGALYFAMKLVEGNTLAALIRALPQGPLDIATLFSLLDVVLKVCDALAFAHSRGILHCDIKPANVMVGEFGQVYLMDWGIARLAATEAAPGSRADPATASSKSSLTDNSVIGTPCYMSPEQALGHRESLDVRSDVFLLGSMLYEVLTRRPPYTTTDRAETLHLAAAGSFPSPRKVAGDGAVPLELERIVMRAMAKAPEDRYATVATLREDLARFMRGGAEYPRKTFALGSVIVREGEPGDAAYIIVTGECEIRKRSSAGRDELVRKIGAGDVFGEMAILTEGPRTATVTATAETTVLVVTSAVLEQEMAALKPWMATLLKSLAVRFRDIDTRDRASLQSTDSPTRLANQLFMHLSTWGERDSHGGLSAPLSKVLAELEAQLGSPPLALFGVVSVYGFELDLGGDRLTLREPARLAVRLRAELDPKT